MSLRFSACDRHVQHGQMVGHEEGVELAALQRLGEALEMGEIEIGVRPARPDSARPPVWMLTGRMKAPSRN